MGDGSIQDTCGVVEVAQAHPKSRLSILRQAARNQNAARNRRVSEANGELIAFLETTNWPPRTGYRVSWPGVCDTLMPMWWVGPTDSPLRFPCPVCARDTGLESKAHLGRVSRKRKRSTSLEDILIRERSPRANREPNCR